MIHVDNALWLLMEKDPSLNPWAGDIRMHLDRYNDRRWHLAGEASLCDFANGHLYFGFHRTETGWVYREWLPGADAAWLTGDPDLIKKFLGNPVEFLEKTFGIDLPDDQINQVIEGVKGKLDLSNIDLGQATGLLGKLKGLFGK